MRFWLLLLSLLFTISCTDIPYGTPTVVVPIPKEDPKPSPIIPLEAPKAKESDVAIEKWPRIHTWVNPGFHNLKMDKSDLGSGWSIHALYRYREYEDLKNGFAFMHLMFENQEDEPIELLFGEPAPVIRLLEERIKPYERHDCTFLERAKTKFYISQNYDETQVYYRVFEYDTEQDKLSEEIKIDRKDGFPWFKAIPKKIYMAKWYAKPLFENMPILLEPGQLPTAPECDLIKMSSFYSSCDKKVARSFLNWCDTRTYSDDNGFIMSSITGIEVGTPGIGLLAQKIGNTKHEERKYELLEFKRPTRLLVP